MNKYYFIYMYIGYLYFILSQGINYEIFPSYDLGQYLLFWTNIIKYGI